MAHIQTKTPHISKTDARTLVYVLVRVEIETGLKMWANRSYKRDKLLHMTWHGHSWPMLWKSRRLRHVHQGKQRAQWGLLQYECPSSFFPLYMPFSANSSLDDNVTSVRNVPNVCIREGQQGNRALTASCLWSLQCFGMSDHAYGRFSVIVSHCLNLLNN